MTTPELLEFLRHDRRQVRGQVARHAGRVLLVQPEQFERLVVGDVLRDIPYMSDKRAHELTKQARVDGMRLCGDLRREQQIELARVLARYAKGAS